MDTITENQVTKLLTENFSRSVIGLKHSVDLDMWHIHKTLDFWRNNR